MKLEVTPKAQQWFKEETGVQSETGIRFFGKIYGRTPVHGGSSIAISVEAPDEPMIKKNLDGITYFIGEADDWFFRGYDLIVDYDGKNDEPRYQLEVNQKDLIK